MRLVLMIAATLISFSAAAANSPCYAVKGGNKVVVPCTALVSPQLKTATPASPAVPTPPVAQGSASSTAGLNPLCKVYNTCAEALMRRRALRGQKAPDK